MVQPIKKNTKPSIELQEEIDYSIAKRVLRGLYNTKMTNIIKLDARTPADAAYTAKTVNNESHYLLELKSVNNDYWKIRGELMQFMKYIKLRQFKEKRDDNEKIIAMFIMNKTNEYYIWDITKLNINDMPVDNVSLKIAQYHQGSDVIPQPCFFLQLDKAVAHGTYQLTEAEKVMIDKKNKLLEQGL